MRMHCTPRLSCTHVHRIKHAYTRVFYWNCSMLTTWIWSIIVNNILLLNCRVFFALNVLADLRRLPSEAIVSHQLSNKAEQRHKLCEWEGLVEPWCLVGFHAHHPPLLHICISSPASSSSSSSSASHHHHHHHHHYHAILCTTSPYTNAQSSTLSSNIYHWYPVWSGVVAARWSRSMKLTYVGPG